MKKVLLVFLGIIFFQLSAHSLVTIKNLDFQPYISYSGGYVNKEKFDVLDGAEAEDQTYLYGPNVGTRVGVSFLGASTGVHVQRNQFKTQWIDEDDNAIELNQMLVGAYASYNIPFLFKVYASWFPKAELKTSLEEKTGKESSLYKGDVKELGMVLNFFPIVSVHASLSQHNYTSYFDIDGDEKTIDSSFYSGSLGFSLNIF